MLRMKYHVASAIRAPSRAAPLSPPYPSGNWPDVLVNGPATSGPCTPLSVPPLSDAVPGVPGVPGVPAIVVVVGVVKPLTGVKGTTNCGVPFDDASTLPIRYSIRGLRLRIASNWLCRHGPVGS